MWPEHTNPCGAELSGSDVLRGYSKQCVNNSEAMLHCIRLKARKAAKEVTFRRIFQSFDLFSRETFTKGKVTSDFYSQFFCSRDNRAGSIIWVGSLDYLFFASP